MLGTRNPFGLGPEIQARARACPFQFTLSSPWGTNRIHGLGIRGGREEIRFEGPAVACGDGFGGEYIGLPQQFLLLVDVRAVHFWAVCIDREANAILLQNLHDPAELAQIPDHAVLEV